MGYCMAQTSLSHTYGNVTCFITEFIKGLFPANYFKTIHISSTIGYRQFNIFQNNNSKEFLRKNKPMLIIRPRIDISNTDTFLYNTFLTTRMDDNYMDVDFSNLQEFILDPQKGINMKFLLNRLSILFDVTIVTETQMEQVNQAYSFKNRIRQEAPFFLHTSLENFIPRELLALIGENVGIPLYDSNGSVKPFLDYINSVSLYPISYKMKNSSGNDEFFRFYPVNIDTSINGLSIDEGTKKNMVADTHTITFTVSTEFNAAGLYYFFTEKVDFIDTFIADMIAGNDKKLIPLFTISNLHTERIADGWNIYASPIYKVDTNKGEDRTDIDTIYNYSMKKLIAHHRDNGIPLQTFMVNIVMKDNEQLIEGVDFFVDYDNMELVTKNLNMDSTYRFIIHVNTLYVNTMIKELLDLDAEK